MNRFKEVLDAFYSEQEVARESGDFNASLAWDTVVDNWDRVIKGVSWQEGTRKFQEMMDILSETDAMNLKVWETARQYVEMAD